MHRTSTAGEKFPEKLSYPRDPSRSPNIVLYPRVLSLKFAIEIRHRDLCFLFALPGNKR
jgi:hypothetical protein